MSLIKRLSKIRGELIENADLSKQSWFGTGGCADLMFIPADMEDLQIFFKLVPKDTPITIIGSMSNILVRSGGIRGIVVRLGKWFKNVFVQGDVIEIGAATSCSELSVLAMDRELGGLEFLSGIPGSIGGAIRMNAGCFGSEICDVLIECETITSNGNVKWFKAKDIAASYRKSEIPDDSIITRAWFKGVQNVRYSIPKKVREIMDMRSAAQPKGVLTCGSTFKNPEGMKAWKLIEDAGCRDMRVGDAHLSEKHCNFIVNDGEATPEDIENLGDKIAQTVLEKTGVQLEWEIIKLGKMNSE